MQNIVSEKLFNLFQDYKEKKFLFVESGGNFGDQLIYLGAEKLSRLVGLDVVTMEYEEFMKSQIQRDTIIYVHGNGGFNRFCSGKTLRILEKVLKEHQGVSIYGPSTFDVDDLNMVNTLQNLSKHIRGEKVYIFTRELKSFSCLNDLDFENVEIDHDTALNLCLDDFSFRKEKGQYDLYAIRTDKEQMKVKRINPFLLWLDPIKNSDSFQEWVSLHWRAKRIITNRTHSAILGTILNKEVTMLPNSYHKNRSIWEYSLKEKGVKWEDRLLNSGFIHNFADIHLVKKLTNSYKLNMFVRNHYGLKAHRL